MEGKNCENCRYYKRHYIINKFGNFMSVCYGHCVNQNINSGESEKRIKKGNPCNSWEPQTLRKKERRANIEKVLKNIEKRLEEIKAILEEDN